jgi:hypothetical protein
LGSIVSRKLDIAKVDIALRRAARRAAYAPPEERAGRFLVSSAIRSVEYDEQTCELDVTFVSGRTYRYSDVPLDVYANFLDAASKGQFFNEHIKDEFSFSEIGMGR